MTVRPNSFAHCDTMRPTPPAAACSRTVSPALSGQIRRIRYAEVKPRIVIAAAVSQDIASGSLISGAAGMILYNATYAQELDTDTHWVPTAHVTNSDGELAPDLVVRHYEWAGYDVLAITDHWVRTDERSTRKLLVIPSTELNATCGPSGDDAHVLALGVEADPEPPDSFAPLQEVVDWVRLQVEGDDPMGSAEAVRDCVRQAREYFRSAAASRRSPLDRTRPSARSGAS